MPSAAAKAEPLDLTQRDGGGHHRGADDAVHVEGIEPEHLLDAEPRDHLRLHEDDAERTAEQKVRERASCGHREEQRQHQVRARQPAGEEPAHRQEGGRLPVGQARNGMARRAATGVRGAEPDEEPADDDRRRIP